jgi:hypothetical protein
MVSDVPLTVAVAVLMRFPELLAVGVVPPLPYLPPPYPLPLVVEVVFCAALDPPVLVLLPQAAKSTTRVAPTSAQHQMRVAACEEERWFDLICTPFASDVTRRQTLLITGIQIFIYLYVAVLQKPVVTASSLCTTGEY